MSCILPESLLLKLESYLSEGKPEEVGSSAVARFVFREMDKQVDVQPMDTHAPETTHVLVPRVSKGTEGLKIPEGGSLLSTKWKECKGQLHLLNHNNKSTIAKLQPGGKMFVMPLPKNESGYILWQDDKGQPDVRRTRASHSCRALVNSVAIHTRSGKVRFDFYHVPESCIRRTNSHNHHYSQSPSDYHRSRQALCFGSGSNSPKVGTGSSSSLSSTAVKQQAKLGPLKRSKMSRRTPSSHLVVSNGRKGPLRTTLEIADIDAAANTAWLSQLREKGDAVRNARERVKLLDRWRRRYELVVGVSGSRWAMQVDIGAVHAAQVGLDSDTFCVAEVYRMWPFRLHIERGQIIHDADVPGVPRRMITAEDVSFADFGELLLPWSSPLWSSEGDFDKLFDEDACSMPWISDGGVPIQPDTTRSLSPSLCDSPLRTPAGADVTREHDLRRAREQVKDGKTHRRRHEVALYRVSRRQLQNGWLKHQCASWFSQIRKPGNFREGKVENVFL